MNLLSVFEKNKIKQNFGLLSITAISILIAVIFLFEKTNIIFLTIIPFEIFITSLFFTKYNTEDSVITSLSIHVIGLTFLYYLFGLTEISFLLYFLLNHLIFLTLKFKNRTKTPSCSLNPKKYLELAKEKLSSFLEEKNLFKKIFLFLNIISLSYLFFSPKITNGLPTPFANIHYLYFIVFFILGFFMLISVIFQKKNLINYLVYFFLAISLTAIFYPLSYGYDTLIHQSTLIHIAKHGQLGNTIPYYIGQYSLEILGHMLSGLKFTFFERWLLPLFFMFGVILSGKILTKNREEKFNWSTAIIAATMFVPNYFHNTTPYGMSLVFVFLGSTYILKGIETKKTNWPNIILCFIAANAIHPFSGILPFVSIIFYKLIEESHKLYSKILLIPALITNSAILPFLFSFLSWFDGEDIILKNPLKNLESFKTLFLRPVWYGHFGDGNFFEKFLFILETFDSLIIFILLIISLILGILKNKRFFIFFAICLSSIISSALILALEIERYHFSDTYYYALRTLNIGKWYCFPIFIYLIKKLFEKISLQTKIVKLTYISILSILLFSGFFITYNRIDNISKPSVNSIRPVDLKSVDFIEKINMGKSGYLVLANQVVSAGAVLQHGFGPYLKNNSTGEEALYYSIPNSGTLQKTYSNLMADPNFQISELKKNRKDFGVKKIYIIFTDYWYPIDENLKKILRSSGKIIKKIEDGGMYNTIILYE